MRDRLVGVTFRVVVGRGTLCEPVRASREDGTRLLSALAESSSFGFTEARTGSTSPSRSASSECPQRITVQVIEDRFDRLLRRLLCCEAAPLEVSVVERRLRMFQVRVGLSQPVRGAVRHSSSYHPLLQTRLRASVARRFASVVDDQRCDAILCGQQAPHGRLSHHDSY